ncbi:hypothetical protein B0H13DRAFT_1882434 [Mycena leptocephala]|nr:hypothetical protein B0H13DRAFT_1882434 [Mycena leptocephala]
MGTSLKEYNKFVYEEKRVIGIWSLAKSLATIQVEELKGEARKKSLIESEHNTENYCLPGSMNMSRVYEKEKTSIPKNLRAKEIRRPKMEGMTLQGLNRDYGSRLEGLSEVNEYNGKAYLNTLCNANESFGDTLTQALRDSAPHPRKQDVCPSEYIRTVRELGKGLEQVPEIRQGLPGASEDEDERSPCHIGISIWNTSEILLNFLSAKGVWLRISRRIGSLKSIAQEQNNGALEASLSRGPARARALKSECGDSVQSSVFAGVI